MARSAAQLWQNLKISLINFNLFSSKPPSTDQNQIENELISTRVFVILLSSTLTILVLYNGLIDTTQTIVIQSPTMKQYLELHSKYESTLTCPCNKVSIKYQQFVQVEYRFHEICQSIFVKQDWINYITQYRSTGSIDLHDFRSIITKIFQSLSTFCDLSKERLDNSLEELYSNQFLTFNLQSNLIFQSQIETFLDQFRSSLINAFLLSISTIRQTTQTNKILSGLLTNFNLFTGQQNTILSSPQVYTNCSCDLSPTCVQQATIYNHDENSTLFEVPGFYIGCYVIESLLQSNLQCFYNQSCIQQLQSYLTLTTTINVTQLNRSLLIHFKENSTVENLINGLMIEKWNSSISFESYYDECRPNECSYTVKKKNSLIYIITTVIGLIGGLVTTLKLLTPRLVGYFRNPRESIETESKREMIRNIYGKILKINLFKSSPCSTDEYEIRNEKISTICFLIVLICSLSILVLYSCLIDTLKTFHIEQPTIEQYLQFYSKYSQRLTCSCSQIAIDYNRIIEINYDFHEICQSSFVSEHWFEYIGQYSNVNSRNVSIGDFRLTAVSMFQSLKSFCHLINQTISNNLIQFYSNKYISSTVTSLQLFRSQTDAFIQQFQSSTTNQFLLSLLTIRSTTQSNGLLAGHLTNYYYTFSQIDGEADALTREWNGCDCIYSPQCSQQSAIYDLQTNSILFEVPGFYIGCYVIESLLQSNLQCFYNQSCIQQLQSYLTLTTTINVTQLNRSLLIRFKENSTVEDLINKLMIEKWNSSISFESYYDECRPNECSYTVKMKNSVVFIITTIIGLIGGLVTTLKLLTPRLVRFVRRKKVKTQSTNVSLYQKMRIAIENLNIFNESTNENEIVNEKISSKVFVVVLIILLNVLLLYTSLINLSRLITITKPSLNEYIELYSKFGDSLTCRCDQLSMSYLDILEVNLTLHEVCSSTFLHHDWIVDISQCDVEYPMYCNDFRCSGPYYFQIIDSYCQLVEQTISNSLSEFYSTEYISSSVKSKEVFQSEIELYISQFISSTTNEFLLSISMIRQITYSNALLSGLLYNYLIEAIVDENRVIAYSESYDDCLCDYTSSCMTSNGFFYSRTGIPLFVIPGLQKGCFMIDSLLKSNLECFYNETCIERIKSFYENSSSMNMKSLDASQLIHFTMNTSMQEITDQLMIDQWNSSISFENYYAQCRPIECTYIYKIRNSAIYIITTIVGLIGGLVTTLKIIIPRFIRFIRFCFRHKTNQIQSQQIQN